jgi:hypothetical protein
MHHYTEGLDEPVHCGAACGTAVFIIDCWQPNIDFANIM